MSYKVIIDPVSKVMVGVCKAKDFKRQIKELREYREKVEE